MSLPEMHLPLFEHIRETGIRWNGNLTAQLQEAGLEDQALAMTSSLLLGHRSMLSPDIRHDFSLAGTSHLLALSGMHLGILYGLLYFLLIKRIRYTTERAFALPLTLILIWGYALLTGFPSSLVRASIMLTISTIMMFSPHFHAFFSEAVPWEAALHTLAVSALLMLLLDPACMWEIGCQLSYSAMLSIVLFHPRWRIGRKWKGAKCCQWALGILGISLVAQIGTMPLVAYYFHTIAPLSIFLNLVLIPLTMLLIYLTLPLLVLPLHGLAKVLAALIGTECRLIGEWVTIPGTSIQHLYPTAWETALIYIALLLLGTSRKMNTSIITPK